MSSGRVAALALLLGAFGSAAFVVYAPALRGPYFSDDYHYVANNPWVQQLTSARFLELLDPAGEPTRFVENYSPVHLLLHAGTVAVAGNDATVHHRLNILLHTGVSVLLVMLLRRTGVPDGFAVFGGAVFLLHPANVEAVAWISQLKTSSALLLAGVALLAFERRPLLATLAFALALLAKAAAAFALPVLIVQLWIRSRRGATVGAGTRRLSLYALGWVAIFAAYAVAELSVFVHMNNAPPVPIPEGAGVRLRHSLAIIPRYLVMAFTGLGVSAFHEPGRAVSLTDPRWILAALAAAGIGARAIAALLAKREESAWWLWAAVSFVPVSQIFPFRYPIADRYLYFMLPGLIGATLLALGPLTARITRQGPWARGSAAVVGLAALLALGAHSHERARLWRAPVLLYHDAARNYPNGMTAHLLAAGTAAQRGALDDAVAELEAAQALGMDNYDGLLGDALFGPLRGHPRFEALVHEMAGAWVERLSTREGLSQTELLGLVAAHQVRGEYRDARRAILHALELGGPFDEAFRDMLRRLPRSEAR